MKFNVEPDITDRENRKKIGIVRMEEWINLTESKCSELRGRTSSGYSTAIDHRQNILQNQQLKIATNNYFCTTITKVHAEYRKYTITH